ncbi:hypothetical protein C8Q80DRAFT_1091665 [Daedaleopsis nitida]|nr:hypothetical protein C8Q80DRAFT_1091665 [Daedaleopsis nitida]
MDNIATMMSPMSSGMEGSAMRIAQYGTNVEGLPELLKVLQDVAQIHPFIALAVGAFKVAIELDLKRRENDKKIGLLFLEMRDMMTALVELQNVQDGPSHVGKDGKTIQARLEGLVNMMVDDIKECANACDAYAKKRLFSKVLQGLRWDDVMQQFVRRFNKRRADIEFALAIHLGMNIDIAHRKLDALDAKIERIIAMLHQTVSPEQRDLATLIERRGGSTAVLADDQLLASIYRDRSNPSSTTPTAKLSRRQGTMDWQALKAEIADDPDIAVANNMETFERKFLMQQRELANEVRQILRHHGDLVVNAVTAGPHEKIVDSDLRNIWKEMRWRGNVKARHFVLALRDYCLEKLDKLRKNEKTFDDYPTNVTEQDEWTLEYINVTRLQAIIEAFDDDASGFITVGEANAFTTARPTEWSLLHWMAYWAIGWQMAMTHYVAEIDRLLEKMFAIKSSVLPANRRFVERYLDSVWSFVTELTSGFRRAEWNDTLQEKFQTYVSAEEANMRGQLETVRYDIDAADTLLLITGPGRIEKHLFLLLYLLLKRDFEIFRLARTTVLHKDELWDSANTLEWVFRAVSDRHNDLENLFKQQNHDPTQQFQVFAFELFKYWHDSTPLWSFDRLRESRYVDTVYSDGEHDEDVRPGDILNHPIENTDDPLILPEWVESVDDKHAQDSVQKILGHWCGFLGKDELFPSEPMLSLDLHAATSRAAQFIASGSIPSGTRWKLVGMVKDESDHKSAAPYTFTITYAARLWPRRFHGTLSDDGRVFSGRWACTSNESGTFFFKRLTCDAMRFWPLSQTVKLEKATPKALWEFALRAVQDQVRRQLLSRFRLDERQDNRQRYLQIIRAEGAFLHISEEDLEAVRRCYLSMTPSEARYYYMIYEYRQRLAPKHYGVTCAHCRATISGARYICLDCHAPRLTVDLCEKADCVAALVGPDRRPDLPAPHLPSHRLLKLRKVIHRHREFGGTYRAAHDGHLRAEAALSDASGIQTWEAAEDLQNGSSHEPTKMFNTVTRKLLCIGCRSPVSRPCWYCVECEDDAFMCTTCEAKNVLIKGKHKLAHALVLCQPPREENQAEFGHPLWFEKRMSSLETKFDTILRESTLRFDALDRRIGDLGSNSHLNDVSDGRSDSSANTVLRTKMEGLDERMGKIETLLATLLEKLGINT